MPGGMRAGWVPCVGFQPMKPSVFMIDEADNPIADECEKAFKRIREAYPDRDDAAAAGPGSGLEGMEDEPIRAPEKPPMKLLMSSRGVQDFHQVQEHYQNLMNQAPQSPEVNKFVTEIASPTGKGAELFAKRKKRMDKFIVDETTVQKSQQTSLSQQSFSSSSTSTSSFNSTSVSSQNVTTGLSVGASNAAGGSYNLPDISKILTQPTTKSEPSKPKPEPSKSKKWQEATPVGSGSGGGGAIPSRPSQVKAANKKLAENSPARSPASTPPSAVPISFSPKPVAKTFSPLCFSPPVGISSSPRTTADSPIQNVCSTKPVAKVFSPLCFSPPILSRSNTTPADSPVPSIKTNCMRSVNNSPKQFFSCGNSATSSPLLATAFTTKPLHYSNSVVKEVNSKYTSDQVPVSQSLPGSFTNTSNSSSKTNGVASVATHKSVASAVVEPITASSTATAPNKKQGNIPAPTSSLPGPSCDTEIPTQDSGVNQALKPGSPPVLVYPDGSETVLDSSGNKLTRKQPPARKTHEDQHNLHNSQSRLSESSHPDFASPISVKQRSGTSNPQKPPQEVTDGFLKSNLKSNAKNDVKTDNFKSTSSKEHKIDSTTTAVHNRRPARPTSLPLISLSSLIGNVTQTHPSSPPSITKQPQINPAYESPSSACNSSSFSLEQGSKSSVAASNGTSVHPILLAGESDSTKIIDKKGSEMPLLEVGVISPPKSSTSVSSKSLPDSSETLVSAVKKETMHSESTKSVSVSVSNMSGNYSQTCSDKAKHRNTNNKELFSSIQSSQSETKSLTKKTEMHRELKEEKILAHSSLQSIKNTSSSTSSHRFKGYDVIASPLPVHSVRIHNDRKRSSLNEDELRKFLSDLEKTFENSPTTVEAINISDLRPPDFYRSVSRASYNEELDDYAPLIINGITLDSSLATPDFSEPDSILDEINRDTPQIESKPSLPLSCNKSSLEEDNKVKEVQDDILVEKAEKVSVEVKVEDSEAVGMGKVDSKNRQEAEVVDGKRALTELESAQPPSEIGSMSLKTPPPMTLPSHGTNIPDPSAGPGAIYTAEVKVVQRASLPPTPIDIPHHNLLELVTDDKSDKRRSASFNLAAKGWGTYKDYYTPVTFAASS